MSKNQRAVVYARQSRERDESTSIEDQVALCERYCMDQGWEVADIVIDRDTSGSERPWRERGQFPRIFEVEADVLVLYRWDRLSRERFDQEEILKKWGALDRTMQAVTEPIDATTANGELNRSIVMMFAAHQAKVIGERWRETLARRHEAGLPKNGLPRFGYLKVEKCFEPDPATGPILREMYLRFVDGAGIQSLRKELNERGVFTTAGNEWSVTSLTRVLDSGWGAGLITNRDNSSYSPGAHDAVITAEEWQRYLDVREARRNKAPRQRVPIWYLTGIARCGLCDGPMHKKNREAVCGTYGKRGKDACSGTFVLRSTLERTVTNWIGAGGIDQFPERDVEGAGAENVVVALEQRLADLHARLGRLAMGWADGTLDSDGYRAARATTLGEQAQVENELRRARDDAAQNRPLTRDEWSKLDLGEVTTGEWNQLLARALRRVELHPDRIVLVPVVGEASEVAR